MIVADTSALVAVLVHEPLAEACMDVLEEENEVLVSAGTLAEALVVAAGRKLTRQMEALIDQVGVTVVPLSADGSRRVAEAYARWGKGIHPARLNLGDCFAYALANERSCPLLYVGKDFAATDIESALA